MGTRTFEIKSYRELGESVIVLLRSVDDKAFQDSVMVEASLYALGGGAPVVEALNNFFSQPILPDRHHMSVEAITNYLSAYRQLEANYLGLFAEQRMAERVVLNQRALITHEPLQEGHLFIWCGEVMYLKGRDTYTVMDELCYADFRFNLENEPAYWVGTVKAIKEAA